MHSRWVVVLSVMGLVVLSLAGCGGKEKEPEKETPPAPAPPAEAKPAPVGPGVPAATALTLKDISSGDYLLARQHAAWANARRSLRSTEPDLNLLRSIDLYLGGRTARRIAKEGDRPKKKEILAALKALGDAYQTQVLSKVMLVTPQVRLKPGVNIDQLRRAFDKIDADYKAFYAMTARGPQTRPASPVGEGSLTSPGRASGPPATRR